MADVSTPSKAHKEMCECADMARALMGGTKAMRKAAQTYLPKEDAESQAAYLTRLSRSTLFNAFAKTVDDMTGKVFQKPVMLKDDVPQQIEDFAENIDLTGRHLNVFARDVFNDAMQTGIGYILTDMPPKVERADGKPATLADEQQAGTRPYFVYIPMERLIGWKSTMVNGNETLTQIRIKECVSEPDGDFAEKEVEQIKVIEPGAWRTYRRSTTSEAEWVQYASGTSSLTKITLAPVYINRTGFMTGKPPLEKLAELNVAHWQSSSDQRNILHVARVPILFGAGWKEGDNLAIGAATMARTSDPAAKLQYVEHSGAAIDAGRTDLKDLEQQMQIMGLHLLIPQPGSKTATGEIRDDENENSPLAMMATALQDAIEQSFGFMAEYIGLGADKGGEVEVNKDFNVAGNINDIPQIIAAFTAGLIDQQTAIDELKRRDFVSDSVETDDVIARSVPPDPTFEMNTPTGGKPAFP